MKKKFGLTKIGENEILLLEQINTKRSEPPDPCGCRNSSNCGSNNWIYNFAQALANR
jgi:hypothetical protein